MEFMTTKEAVQKWNISERRIRQLLQDGRIEGAVKVGNNWNIPINANKPADKRSVKLDNTEFIFDLPDNYFDKVDELNKELNSKRPISKETLKSLKESINLEWTYNSNGIEGNTLTLRETQVVLEGITVGGKSLKEHLEVINHEQAILFLDDLIKDKEPITEWNIKNIHQLVLKEIDDDNAGKYRDENVKIKGATHIPPDYLIVPELMEKLIINYEDWKKYHPIIRAALLHGELVKIHPFVDGNGRTSRLVMNLSLMNSGYLPVIVKKEKRLEYYNASDKAHTTGDYTDFVKLVNELEIEMLNKYLELINSGYTREDIAVLTAKNIGSSGTNLVNSCIQHIINPIDEFDDTISIIVGDNKITFKENDLVMNIKNNYNAKILNSDEKTLLANGQIGVIKYIDEVNKKMIVEIEDNEFEFEYPDICNLRLAYCFTIHKAQGSQFKNVIYLTSNDDMFMTNSNLCYVAITRAQENCYHFGDDFVINSKISERENLKRNTTLTLQFNNVL